MADPRVKGVAFRSLVRSLETLKGEAAVRAAYRAMPAHVASALQYGELVATGWYPIEWYRAVIAAVVREAPARDLGAQSIRDDMNGPYRVLLRLLRPETLLSIAPKIFDRYYDTGRLVIHETRRGYIRGTFEGCIGWDSSMWQEVLGSCLEVVHLAGGTNVRARTVTGGKDDDDACEIEVFWS